MTNLSSVGRAAIIILTSYRATLNSLIISTLGITASVIDGKATLIGTVKTAALKTQVERLVKSVKGVKSVDNQLSVISE